MSDVLFRPVLLVLLCAAAYVVATYSMKLAATSPTPMIVGIICACLSCAVVAEVQLLRHYPISLAYVAILAIESLMILGIAYAIGEGLGSKQMLGAVLVLVGTLLVSP
jgi:multidrug transporter EmrE-like cation transporter